MTVRRPLAFSFARMNHWIWKRQVPLLTHLVLDVFLTVCLPSSHRAGGHAVHPHPWSGMGALEVLRSPGCRTHSFTHRQNRFTRCHPHHFGLVPPVDPDPCLRMLALIRICGRRLVKHLVAARSLALELNPRCIQAIARRLQASMWIILYLHPQTFQHTATSISLGVMQVQHFSQLLLGILSYLATTSGQRLPPTCQASFALQTSCNEGSW